ncbi:MAG TPA: 3-dehydroquinate synthase [Opitutaceae bacterium]|nr:3-dehydroquinate synthase [Opitutaceae bacterium]
MAERLTVRLGARSYWIHFDGDLTAYVRGEVDALISAGRKVAVVTDSNLAKAQGPALAAMFGDTPLFQLPPGEGAKNLESFGRILDFLAEQRMDRRSVLFAVGGGVVGDLTGYAAASYLRGIQYYQVPTTLLAMVDSSVGGKTGLNLRAGKNLVGAFHQPSGVFIATGLLGSLPAREFAAGMAEVIKYGLLGDAQLFAELESAPLTLASPNLSRVIHRCCEMKAEIVQADEHETAAEGGRALLNLGHTFGHAIEQVTGYGAYLHGEAVAIGLAAAARLSHKLGKVDATAVTRTEAVVVAHHLPIRLKTELAISDLMAAMGRDKKVRAGLPRFIVLESLGRTQTKGGLEPSIIETVWREIGAK